MELFLQDHSKQKKKTTDIYTAIDLNYFSQLNSNNLHYTSKLINYHPSVVSATYRISPTIPASDKLLPPIHQQPKNLIPQSLRGKHTQ